jgi:hypothetical protein
LFVFEKREATPAPVSFMEATLPNRGVRFQKWFRVFFLLNCIALSLLLVGSLSISDYVVGRSSNAVVEVWSPVDMSSCIEEAGDSAEEVKRVLVLVEKTVKTTGRGVVHAGLPNYEQLALVVAVLSIVNFVNIMNMEYPYSLCLRNGRRTGGIPEPMFSFELKFIIYNFFSKLLMMLLCVITLFQVEMLGGDASCDEILLVSSKQDLALATNEGKVAMATVKRHCEYLQQACGLKVTVDVPAAPVSPPLILFSLGTLLLMSVAMVKWYVWINFIADTVVDINPNAVANRDDRDENQFIRMMNLRRERRIRRLLNGEIDFSNRRQRRRRETSESKYTRLGGGVPGGGGGGESTRRLGGVARNPYSIRSPAIVPLVDQGGEDVSAIEIAETGVGNTSGREKPFEVDLDCGDVDCVICLEEIEANGKEESLPCGHVFHSECINLWFNSNNATNCPICRTRVER